MEVTTFTDICYPSSSSFIQYLPIPLSRSTFNKLYYIKGMRMFLATSDRSSEMNILLGYGQVHHNCTLPLPIIQFSSSSLTDSPRICSCPRTGLLGHRPSPLDLNSTSGSIGPDSKLFNLRDRRVWTNI